MDTVQKRNKIVWINGCFDVLHYGHFAIIDYAASLGGRVVIGIDTDDRVRSNKGKNRPFHTAEQRKFNLCQLRNVDKVVMFSSDKELITHIRKEKPDYMVIGSEYKDKRIVGVELFEKVFYFNKIENLSTSNIMSHESN